MRDANRIQKLLNLTSSSSDAEALNALRLAQKLLQDDTRVHLGDFLADQSGGFQRSVSQQLYDELQELYEVEVSKGEALKKALQDKEKTLRKYQKDILNLKRDLARTEEKLEEVKQSVLTLSDELLLAKRR